MYILILRYFITHHDDDDDQSYRVIARHVAVIRSSRRRSLYIGGGKYASIAVEPRYFVPEIAKSSGRTRNARFG